MGSMFGNDFVLDWEIWIIVIYVFDCIYEYIFNCFEYKGKILIILLFCVN